MYIPDRNSIVMDEVGFRIPRLDSGFQGLDSGFQRQKNVGFRIPDFRFPYKGRERSYGTIKRVLFFFGINFVTYIFDDIKGILCNRLIHWSEVW